MQLSVHVYRSTALWLQRRSYRLHQSSFKKQCNKPAAESFGSCNTFVSPVYRAAINFKDRIALKDKNGQYTYERLLTASDKLASHIAKKVGDSKQQKIAFLCPNDASYVITQWASWMNGHIVVPLSPLHPQPMLDYFIKDSESNLIVTTPEFQSIVELSCKTTSCPFLIINDELRIQSSVKADGAAETTRNKLIDLAAEELSVDPSGEVVNYSRETPSEYFRSVEKIVDNLPEDFYKINDAMIVYTSGSTGQPKGVLISHKNLNAQIRSIVSAWQCSSSDTVLHCLSLNHIHGIVNALLCPLAVGARCVMLPSFDANQVWKQILGVRLPESERVNIFMGVPTMYVKLIDKYMQSLAKNERMVDYVRASCMQKMRIFVSGSAPLPTQLFEKWHFITGHKMLERYGMTETGMVLTNPLDSDRQPGSVGNPFPEVEVRIVDMKGNVLAKGTSQGTQIIDKGVETVVGELHVKGDNVFTEYYQKPEQTKETFTNGWFKTGDQVSYSNNGYKILGRQSVDIIKTGGYKVSAIHIETALRDHPDIKDVAVVGINDITWGQKVVAVVESTKGDSLDQVKLVEWAKTKLPPYEVPTQIHVVKSIPRNALGKVNKRNLISEMFSPKESKSV